MKNNKAILQGYMTVGELAKKANTTVRTLQYYDKEGLLTPSAQSEGGRRLYTDKDVVRLHQIQTMKYLGFSLDDIKNRLVSLDTPEEVAVALAEQEKVVREKIAMLSDVLQAIEKLRTETLQMKTVDFKKYAAIVVNLQMKNDYYGLIKFFDDDTLEHCHSNFDMEKAAEFMSKIKSMLSQIAEYQKKDIPPQSEQGQALAKAWWDMVMDFTNGDMSLLPNIIKVAENKESLGEGWPEAESYLNKALEVYFTNLGINPFEGVGQ